MSEDGQTKPLGRCRNEDHFALHRARSRASRGSGEWRLRVARISIDAGAGAHVRLACLRGLACDMVER